MCNHKTLIRHFGCIFNPQSRHKKFLRSMSILVKLSKYGVAELTWENVHLSMHELGMILPTAQTKTTWDGTSDTLESIVNQATSHGQNINLAKTDHHRNHLGTTSSIVKSYNRKCGENLHHLEMAPGFTNKRVRSEYSDQEHADRSACASASATFCMDNDTTMMTWPFLESPRSLKTKSVVEDSACHDDSENRDKEHETKGETGRSHTTRRSRDADVHNQSERRRRDRINQKMKALQKLVPNANKTDKASVLDEVIAYLKQLQAQVQMMSVRNMPQMMMPLGMQQQLQMMGVGNMPQMMMPLEMQQQLQMSLLARMGMGIGLGMNAGMLDMTTLPQIHPNPATAAAPTFIQPPFMVPPMIQSHISSQSVPSHGATNTSVPFNDPYCAFLARSMNMELYNKMAAAAAATYQQEVNQAAKTTSDNSKSNNVHGE